MSSVSNGSTPIQNKATIARQHIILVLLLMVIGALVWWPHAGGSAPQPVQKLSMPPLPDAIAEMDFTYAESAWNELRLDPAGNLLINAQTESALSETAVLLQNPGYGQAAFTQQRARVALLLEKQLGANLSQQFMQLLIPFISYKAAEARWFEANDDNYPPPFAELFQLQDELLGEALAAQIFAGQRRMAAMMLASHQILHDPNLTEDEKDQALIDLQDAFQDEEMVLE